MKSSSLCFAGTVAAIAWVPVMARAATPDFTDAPSITFGTQADDLQRVFRIDFGINDHLTDAVGAGCGLFFMYDRPLKEIYWGFSARAFAEAPWRVGPYVSTEIFFGASGTMLNLGTAIDGADTKLHSKEY